MVASTDPNLLQTVEGSGSSVLSENLSKREVPRSDGWQWPLAGAGEEFPSAGSRDESVLGSTANLKGRFELVGGLSSPIAAMPFTNGRFVDAVGSGSDPTARDLHQRPLGAWLV